jgi:hypothetical protein
MHAAEIEYGVTGVGHTASCSTPSSAETALAVANKSALAMSHSRGAFVRVRLFIQHVLGHEIGQD